MVCCHCRDRAGPCQSHVWGPRCGPLCVRLPPAFGQGRILSLRFGLTGGFTLLLESMGLPLSEPRAGKRRDMFALHVASTGGHGQALFSTKEVRDVSCANNAYILAHS